MATLATKSSFAALADIIRAAIVFGPDAWRDGGSGGQNRRDERVGPGLSQDLFDLFALLRDRQVPYLLVGGIALLKYVDGRNTQDIDLVLSAASLDALPEIEVSAREMDFARGRFRGLSIVVPPTRNPVFQLALERYATTHSFGDIDVRCATVAGLVLLKLYALPSLYRQGDGQRIALYEADMLMLLQRHRPDTEPLLSILALHLDAGAMAELRNILGDISQRIARIDSAADMP